MAGPGRGSRPASSSRTQGEPAESVRRALHTDPRAPQAPGGGRPLPALSPPPRRGVEGPPRCPQCPPTSQRPATAAWKHRVGGGKEGTRRIHTLPPAGLCYGGSKPGMCTPCRLFGSKRLQKANS
ncbi:translation initiation factor IF-2-like [Peromyscus californicus insignis]|uniref:translation initiation factor IF-2-like n=1 Tax=Peromyscus californicus insignis TaxID=564181 RepID=UPI0022A6F1B7|nr:translation initiation factor IF-2-like [Peromyscus californicus insignis]